MKNLDAVLLGCTGGGLCGVATLIQPGVAGGLGVLTLMLFYFVFALQVAQTQGWRELCDGWAEASTEMLKAGVDMARALSVQQSLVRLLGTPEPRKRPDAPLN